MTHIKAGFKSFHSKCKFSLKPGMWKIFALGLECVLRTFDEDTVIGVVTIFWWVSKLLRKIYAALHRWSLPSQKKNLSDLKKPKGRQKAMRALFWVKLKCLLGRVICSTCSFSWKKHFLWKNLKGHQILFFCLSSDFRSQTKTTALIKSWFSKNGAF